MSSETDGWAIAGQFSRLEEAQSALLSLIGQGLQAELRDQAGEVPTYDEASVFYVWVPGDLAEQAKSVLSPGVSNDELTKEALESPPPDDA